MEWRAQVKKKFSYSVFVCSIKFSFSYSQGSGKTAAFLIPMIEKLRAHSARVSCMFCFVLFCLFVCFFVCVVDDDY